MSPLAVDRVSFDEIDVTKLSERGREAFDLFAVPMSEGASYDEISLEAGVEKREIIAAMEALRDELTALQYGATLTPLSTDDYEALRESIREHGQLVPILVDSNGEIVDGAHRARACAELGVKPKTVRLITADESADRVHDVALAANLARRQLTTADKRRLVAAELVYKPERSDRTIASAIGVSPTTVGVVRRELVETGQVSRLDRRQASDGTVRPATQPDRERPLAAESTGTRVRGQITFAMSSQLAGEMTDWSEPVQLRVVKQESGEYELLARTYRPEPA